MTEPEPRLSSEAFRSDRRRSWILTVVAQALVILPVLAIGSSVRANHAVLYGRWYLPYLVLVGSCCGVAGVLLWRQRRLGAWIAWFTLVSNGAFTVFLGEAGLFSLALPAGLCLAIALEYQDLR